MDSLKSLICVIFIFIFVIESCDRDSNIVAITMNDGNEITINKLDVAYYRSEAQFEQSSIVTENIPIHTKDVEYIDYKDGKSYTIYKRAQTFTINWKIARFGEWISNYGLKPKKKYYVSTKVYAINVISPPSGLMISPKFYSNGMGYPPNGGSIKTFNVIQNKMGTNISTLITCTKFIGYDEEKNKIDINIPQLNDTIKWSFLIQKDGWE